MYPPIKHIIDKITALMLLIAFSPVILVITLLLAFANRKKPFFSQPRPGQHGQIFTLVKFKTMNDRRDDQGQLLPDAERLTPVGAFIRKTSLDELLQLVNVLKGDMSIVGPRPLLVEYLALYNATQARRHEVRPGITGWAQVNGRNAITWEQKFEYDVWYVENLSFALDMKILWRTISKVLRSQGINAPGAATMEKFKGTHT